MTKINHRRKNKPKVDRRYPHEPYTNGYARPDSKRKYHDGELVMPEGVDETQSTQRVGRTGYLDKSLHAWGDKSEFSDKSVWASISNDFTNGHRGMAKAVRGAKKYVRSRKRFHDKATLKQLVCNDAFTDDLDGHQCKELDND